jgi:hypothetical protein
MPCFCTGPEEDLDQAKVEIKRHMKDIIEQINSVRIRGYDPEVVLMETHKLMDDLYFGKCQEKD